LSHSLFPVGEYPKAEIRRLAGSFGLPTADRPDSQDLCFLAGGDYRNFIRRNLPEILRPGNIVTRAGDVLGEHSGLANYTIGQRKGLGFSSAQPLYVLGKDAAANVLIVGAEQDLVSTEMIAGDLRWISGAAPSGTFRAEVKVRYTAHETAAEVQPQDDGLTCRVRFDAPVRGITPGQAAVFYNGEVVLGGGTILL
jgi:tRNA-specific 2-thiouridylase